MKFCEVETKYRSESIKLQDFCDLAVNWVPKDTLIVSGWDYYFVSEGDPDEFIRYRASPTKPQLTMKRKSKVGNNYVRREVNLPIAKDATLETVTVFCEDLGFKFNFKIWKSCWIFWFDLFNVVYYIVSDAEIKERDRFIEIEMDEEHPWVDSTEAWTKLVEVEKSMESLGISPQSRLKKSLFEMFRKPNC